MSTDKQFKTKIGLIAATVGSAVGLGNIWRFPAETQANGGAAFLLVYIGCVLILGIPVMLAELALGRGGRSDAIGVFRKLSPGKPWWLVGIVAVLASYVILSFYMVVSGWTLEYLWESITGGLFEGIGTDTASYNGAFTAKMNQYISTSWRPLLFTFLLIAANIGVLVGGVSKGIEKLSNIMMPLLFIILIVMCCVTLTLPDAGRGVSFFLTPDFSKITPTVIANGLGQAFFSLSLGTGILITYASYYPADTKMTSTSVTVVLLSLVVAVMMGLVIFPAVTSFGLDNEPLQGATLVFVTLPEVFARLPFPQLWATLFFILLLTAALTSTVSIAEVSVSMMQDRFGMSRRRATLTALLPMLLLSTPCALSFGPMADFKIFGYTVFDLFDTFATDILLPSVSLAVCLYIGWFAPKGLLRRELTNNGTLRGRLTTAVIFLIRFVAPVLIAMILVFNYLL